jgi:hypothetical protein
MARLTTKGMVIAGGVALVLLAGGTAAGAAIASGPVDGSGVIHGCWTNTAINGSHAFILQDAGTACPNGTTAISWNQTGPQGPAGPARATGPAGPAGAQGPPGQVIAYQTHAGPRGLVQLGDTFAPVAFLSPPPGALLVNATATFLTSGPATVTCQLADGQGNVLDTEASTASSSGDIFVALTGATPAGPVGVKCSSSTSSSTVTTQDVSVTGIPVALQ